MATVGGACDTDLVAGVSTAVNPEPQLSTSPLRCGDGTLLVDRTTNSNYGNKNAANFCDVCDKDFNGTEGHIDNYISNDSCNPRDHLDLGNFWTLKQ